MDRGSVLGSSPHLRSCFPLLRLPYSWQLISLTTGRNSWLNVAFHMDNSEELKQFYSLQFCSSYRRLRTHMPHLKLPDCLVKTASWLNWYPNQQNAQCFHYRKCTWLESRGLPSWSRDMPCIWGIGNRRLFRHRNRLGHSFAQIYCKQRILSVCRKFSEVGPCVDCFSPCTPHEHASCSGPVSVFGNSSHFQHRFCITWWTLKMNYKLIWIITRVNLPTSEFSPDSISST